MPAWRTLIGHTGPIEALAFLHRGTLLALGIARRHVPHMGLLERDDAAGSSRCSIRSTAVAVSPDGERLGIGDRDGVIRIWDVHPPRARLSAGSVGAIAGLAFSPDGSRIVSAAGDGRLRVWRLRGASSIAVLDAHSGATTAWACVSRSLHIATGGSDGRVRIWDIGRDPLHADARDQPEADQAHWPCRHSLHALPPWTRADASGCIPSAGPGSRFRCPPARIPRPLGTAVSVSLFPGGRTLAIGGPDRGARIWAI